MVRKAEREELRSTFLFSVCEWRTCIDECLHGPCRASADHHVRGRHHAHSIHEILHENSEEGGRGRGEGGRVGERR